MVEGDCIRVHITEDFFNYIKSVILWEKDRYTAYQNTLDYELNPEYINVYSHLLSNDLWNWMAIEFTAEYLEEYSKFYIDYVIIKVNDKTFNKTPITNRIRKSTLHYLSSYPLELKDLNKKFFLVCNSF